MRTQVREGLAKRMEESDQKRLSIVLVKSSFHYFIQKRTRGRDDDDHRPTHTHTHAVSP